jgi:hypothetical protein
VKIGAVLLVAACGAAKPVPASPPPPVAAPTPAPAAAEIVDARPATAPEEEPRGEHASLVGRADISSGFDDRPAPPRRRVGNVWLEQPEIRGDLEKAVLRKYISEKLSAFVACYEHELSIKSELRGTVTVDFLITASGSVATATATGMTKVDACIAAEVKKIQFMRPHDGASVQVVWPIKLSSRAY